MILTRSTNLVHTPCPAKRRHGALSKNNGNSKSNGQNNKKKRKLKAPIVSLTDKAFLLNTPGAAHETPGRTGRVRPTPVRALSRGNLTYTPMTRRLLQKQQKFVPRKGKQPKMPLPSKLCSSTTSFQIRPTNTVHPQQQHQRQQQSQHHNQRRKVKKRKYAEIAATEESKESPKSSGSGTGTMGTAPIIPGSVRKKRRLNSESSAKLSRKKKHTVMKAATHKLNRVINARNIGKVHQTKSSHQSTMHSTMSPTTKQSVMRKVLNNEFNPKLSLSPNTPPTTSTSPLQPVLLSLPQQHNELQTPVKAASTSTSTPLTNGGCALGSIVDLETPINEEKKKRKRRLSSSVEMLSNLVLTPNDKLVKVADSKPMAKPAKSLTAPVQHDQKDLEIDDHDDDNDADSDISLKPKLVSRRRKKRHSLSSGAVKAEKSKKSTVKAVPSKKLKVKRTYNRRKRKSMTAMASQSMSLSLPSDAEMATSEPKTKTKPKQKSVCPLTTRLSADRGRRSHIALVSAKCLSAVADSPRLSNKQSSVLRKLDSFLALLARAEILLSNDERARREQILQNHDITDSISKLKTPFTTQRRTRRTSKSAKSATSKKSVRFCCYDLSTVSPPLFGELESEHKLHQIARLLVLAGKIGAKVFGVKSDSSWTRKTLAMLMNAFREFLSNHSNNATSTTMSAGALSACRYLLREFEEAHAGRIAYPLAHRLEHCLSSLIRFYMKTIFNASEFARAPKIPAWYGKIGSFSVVEGEQTEFLPYYASEIAINLENLFLKNRAESENVGRTEKEVLDALGLEEDPVLFFLEMKAAFDRYRKNDAVIGAATYKARKNARQSEFEKYLDAKWKDLRATLNDVRGTKTEALFFYLPLLDFRHFLNRLALEDAAKNSNQC